MTPILEDFLMENSIIQVNKKPTYHQCGQTTEHEGVKCVVLTKDPVKLAKLSVIRDFPQVTSANIQPLIDASENLQILFSDSDPSKIMA